MTQSCPEHPALVRWIDRDLGARDREEIQRHVADCATCTTQADALGRLIGELRVPAGPPPSPEAIRRVMRRLDEPRPRHLPAWTWMTGAAMALACAVALWGGVLRRDAGFQARGGASDALERWVGTTVYTLHAPSLTALTAGAPVRSDTAFTLGYRNLVRDRAMWLLAFAVDAAGDVHWLYPGYTAIGDTPEAMPLAASDDEVLMSESVTLERPAPGALRVISLISPDRLRISTIEGLATSELTLPALERRFPDAVITELPLQVVP